MKLTYRVLLASFTLFFAPISWNVFADTENYLWEVEELSNSEESLLENIPTSSQIIEEEVEKKEEDCNRDLNNLWYCMSNNTPESIKDGACLKEFKDLYYCACSSCSTEEMFDEEHCTACEEANFIINCLEMKCETAEDPLCLNCLGEDNLLYAWCTLQSYQIDTPEDYTISQCLYEIGNQQALS